LNDLATGARDMVSLDKSCIFFSSQVFHSLGTKRKITLCLSLTFGVVQFGKVAHESQPGCEIFRSLTLTGSVITHFFFLFLLPHAILCVYDCLSGLCMTMIFLFEIWNTTSLVMKFGWIYKIEGPNVWIKLWGNQNRN